MKLVTNFLVSIVSTGIALTGSARDCQELVAEGSRRGKPFKHLEAECSRS